MKLSAAICLAFFSTLAVASSFEQGLLSLAFKEKDDFTKADKRRFKSLLQSSKLTDELLEKAFKPCIHNKLPACELIIAECGMRLPQEDVDHALIEKAKHGRLFAALLQGTNANPHRYGKELFLAYENNPRQDVLHSLMECPRFDPTTDDNCWIKAFAEKNSDQEVIIMLSDARVAATADITSLMNSAIRGNSVFTASILAAHPNADLDQIDRSHPGSAVDCVLQISDLLKVAKNPTGQYTEEQEEALTQLLNEVWIGDDSCMSIIYACLCSGNLQTLHWMKIAVLDDGFRGGKFNTQYYGQVKLQMASTAACHGHLEMVQYLLTDEELEEDELNRILDVAHKANQLSISDWAAAKLRELQQVVHELHLNLDKYIEQGELLPEEVMEDIISTAQEFSLYDMNCPAITRQIIRDLEYKIAVAGCLSRGLPKELTYMIAEAVRQHPMPITGHI